MHPWGLEAVEQVQAEGPVERHFDRRFTDDEAVHWYETFPRHGRFRRGAILGTSSLVLEARILETNLDLHATFFDISDGALARRRELLGSRFPGRVATEAADLNFVELPANAYDASSSSRTTSGSRGSSSRRRSGASTNTSSTGTGSGRGCPSARSTGSIPRT
ncbi:MAG TPA: hypothetical protein VKA21_09850 [Candidatus Binatia bacterium]|nr:hypothetical protein [Candidatus Binatia bacterium]